MRPFEILMTGTDGYIGSHLKPYLESKGYRVIAYQGDISTFDVPNREWVPDMVIHLAALTGVRRSLEHPEEYYKVNVEGTRKVFQVCEELEIPILFASSSNAKEVTNPYAETKLINEQDRPKNSVGFRPHTVYPGRQDMLFQSLIRGDVKYINSEHFRDFTHIDDLCSAIFTIIKNYGKLMGNVIDIGTSIPVSVLEVAMSMGFNGEVKTEATPHERLTTMADISELVQLGWNPTKVIFDEIHSIK